MSEVNVDPDARTLAGLVDELSVLVEVTKGRTLSWCDVLGYEDMVRRARALATSRTADTSERRRAIRVLSDAVNDIREALTGDEEDDDTQESVLTPGVRDIL